MGLIVWFTGHLRISSCEYEDYQQAKKEINNLPEFYWKIRRHRIIHDEMDKHNTFKEDLQLLLIILNSYSLYASGSIYIDFPDSEEAIQLTVRNNILTETKTPYSEFRREDQDTGLFGYCTSVSKFVRDDFF